MKGLLDAGALLHVPETVLVAFASPFAAAPVVVIIVVDELTVSKESR